METADFAFVNFSAGDHGAKNCFMQDAEIDRSAPHQCCGHAMAPAESNLEPGVGIDPSLREFAVGNQISARGVRLPHDKSATAGKLETAMPLVWASLQQPNCALGHSAFNPRQPRRNISVALTFFRECRR